MLPGKSESRMFFEVKGKVYAFDSITIDGCLSVFWWAESRKHEGGINAYPKILRRVAFYAEEMSRTFVFLATTLTFLPSK
jgi:hypothetical protein